MLNKANFFDNYFINSNSYKKNVKKTKKAFKSLVTDFKNLEIPLLDTFDKNYKFTFSDSTVKKFYKFNNIIIIGMGGSILGAKCIYSFLKNKITKNLFFFDNLDPNLNLEYKKIKNINNSCFIIVSKSGNTLETITNLNLIFSKKILKNKLIIITEINDNGLMSIATKYEAEIIEHKTYIGGRYSVLSESGMFPAALMGLNLKRFKNFKNLINNKKFINCLIKNVACIHTLNKKRINNSVILNYDSDLNNLGYWYQQLVSESLGKKGKGISPMMSFGPKDHHSLLQLYLDGPKNKFFTFFNSSKKQDKYKIQKNFLPKSMSFLKNKNLNRIVNAQCEATKNIFKLKKIPYRQITFNKKNEEELGAFFIFFILETILLARLMNVNPFNQPAVEQVKIETEKFLK